MSDIKYYCIVHNDYVEGVLNVVPIYLHSFDKTAFVCTRCAKVHRTDGKETTFPQMEAQIEELLEKNPWLLECTMEPQTIAKFAAEFRKAKNELREELDKLLL